MSGRRRPAGLAAAGPWTRCGARTLLLLVLVLHCQAADAAAPLLRLPALFCDHAVLQRDMACPVWGWAPPGAVVTVALQGRSVQGTAGADGAWRVDLPPLEAGGPFELTIACAGETRVLRDIAVGEVWLCAGQGNMGMAMVQSATGLEDLARADLPGMRLFSVAPLVTGDRAPDTIGRWEPCSQAGAAWFSALAYHLGYNLHHEMRLPVGIIQATWGEAPIAAWTPLAQEASAPGTGIISWRQAQAHRPRYAAAIARWRRGIFLRDRGDRGMAEGWADPAHDASRWASMHLPTAWEDATPALAIDGVVWFRKEVELPVGWRGRDLTLRLGAIDDLDTTYVDGVEVGANRADTDFWWEAPRLYQVPGHLARRDRLLIAVRVFDMWGPGGMRGGADWMSIAPTTAMDGDQAIPLAGTWSYAVESSRDASTLAMVPRSPEDVPPEGSAGGLFNGMIAPLIPYGLAGIAWQQGEADVAEAAAYRERYPALISVWRAAWKREDLTWIYAQAGSCASAADAPGAGRWADLREAQATVLAMPATGMAVTFDVASQGSPHPLDKRTIGGRLAGVASAMRQGRPAVGGPRYRSSTVTGSAIVVEMAEPQAGLVLTGDGGPGTFLIAGADRVFVSASVRVDGDRLVVWNDAVPDPAAVRYAWSDRPSAVLFDGAGLPAAPFRTDHW